MRLLAYTRQPLEDAVYANRLAYSMHLALQGADGAWKALNHNSGVLFVKATENPDGSLNPKSLKNPWLFPMGDGSYGVFAVRTVADGGTDTEDLGTAVFWTTKDLVHYEERGLVKLSDAPLGAVRCQFTGSEAGAGERKASFQLQWQSYDGTWWETKEIYSPADLFLNDQGKKIGGRSVSRISEADLHIQRIEGENFEGIQGVIPGNSIEIPDELGEYLLKKLMPAVMTGAKAPAEVRVKKGEALPERSLADVFYSDGTKVARPVLWNTESLGDTVSGTPGRYPVSGKVYQPHFVFPICTDRADPCVCRWNGKYYYIATNDADGNHTLYMRCADCLEKIGESEEHLILDSSTYEDIGGLLWAPEFHEIDGRLYLFHACTPGPFFCEESHVMELREGGDPLCREDWSRPRRVVRKDGSELCEQGKEITLDMTEFEWQGELYAIWSQRQFLPKDLGAWLYIAKLNRKKPWMLDSDPVVLSKPEYGWANNHTFVDEGPFALIRGDRLFVTFSSAAVDSTYVVGLLDISAGKDLLVRENWRKSNYPLFTSRSYEGEYGTGHNAYVIDEDGIVWNTYHARPGVNGPRSTGFRRVHFDIDGEPMLDVTEELDYKEEFATVKTEFVVE